jgi:GNAT superfamily N-acetyltransferase
LFNVHLGARSSRLEALGRERPNWIDSAAQPRASSWRALALKRHLEAGVSLSFRFAAEADAPAILALRFAVDAEQEFRFGDDRWTTTISEASVARGLKSSRVVLATSRGRIVGMLRMETKKPWAIDLAYFTPVPKAVYLHDVDVEPRQQRSGIGTQLMERAKSAAREWPVNAIRLDAYDGPAGAGPFYAKCGFTEVGRVVYRSVPLVYYELVL